MRELVDGRRNEADSPHASAANDGVWMNVLRAKTMGSPALSPSCGGYERSVEAQAPRDAAPEARRGGIWPRT